MTFSMKNKDSEAALRGYLLFRVNGRIFFSYGAANRAAKLLAGTVWFDGFHILKGWRGFLWRVELGVENWPRYPSERYLAQRERALIDELAACNRYFMEKREVPS